MSAIEDYKNIIRHSIEAFVANDLQNMTCATKNIYACENSNGIGSIHKIVCSLKVLKSTVNSRIKCDLRKFAVLIETSLGCDCNAKGRLENKKSMEALHKIASLEHDMGFKAVFSYLHSRLSASQGLEGTSLDCSELRERPMGRRKICHVNRAIRSIQSCYAKLTEIYNEQLSGSAL